MPLSRRDFLRGAAALGGLGALARPARAARLLTAGPPSIARVWARTAGEARVLTWLDDTHVRYADASVQALLWPGDRERLEAMGARFEIIAPDATAAVPGLDRAGATPQPGERTTYRTLADYETELAALAAAHPSRARLITLPGSTLEGRSIVALEIARDVGGQDGRPTFVIDGLHHAREWPSGELCIMFAYDLLGADGVDPRVTAILDGVRTLVVPVQNPDGFNHAREALVHRSELAVVGLEGYWRKNRRSFTGVTVVGRNPDAHGTDTNRNYSFMWGGPGGDRDPTSQTYAGMDAFAEPESRLLAELMRSRQVTSYLTNHTAGRLVLRPWGWTAANPVDEAMLLALSDAIVAVNGYDPRKGIGLYPTAGTSRDWAYGSMRTLVFTLEHATEFRPFYGQIPPMYASNRNAFLLMAEAAMDPARHGVITGRAVDANGAGVAGTVTVSKSFHTPRGDGGAPVPETIASVHGTASDGTFAIHVNPSTRPLVALAGGSEAWTVTVEAPGRAPASLSVTIARGQTVHVGDR